MSHETIQPSSDRILSGNRLAKRMRETLKMRIQEQCAVGKRPPCLAVIQIGANPASTVYVGKKEEACAEVGMRSRILRFPEQLGEEALLKHISLLNQDPEVDGILCQLPLPQEYDVLKIQKAIDPSKDVDGFHPLNQGALLVHSDEGLIPCTPKGILHLLDEAHLSCAGKLALVIGRSRIVGLPVAQLLLQKHATVIQAHSRTQNLRELCQQADIVVVAAGVPNLVQPDWIRAGSVIVDVGIHRLETGKLCGDVSKEAYEKAAYYTPVPGGVGPMTVAELLENTWLSYQRGHESRLEQKRNLQQLNRVERILTLLQDQSKTVAVAESCTAGMVSASLGSCPGISSVFLGGVIAYTEETKIEHLRVDPQILEQQGAVSASCARAMAQGVRTALGADIGLAVTGLAGPSIPSGEEQPLGTVYLACARPGKQVVEHCQFEGTRQEIREQATEQLLALLERSLHT